MLDAMHPPRRHDGGLWRDTDSQRSVVSGRPLGFKAVVTFIKSDLMEHSHSLGLPALNDGISPCPFCYSTLRDLFDFAGVSPLGTAWPQKTLANYLEACSRCEVPVTLTADVQKVVVASLVYDKSRSGAHGRTLTVNVPAAGLLKKDRLEPSSVLPNAGSLDDAPAPAQATFWRQSRETHARHRNSLFHPSTGISPTNSGCTRCLWA